MGLITSCYNCGDQIDGEWQYCPSCAANQKHPSDIVLVDDAIHTSESVPYANRKNRGGRIALSLGGIVIVSVILFMGLRYETGRSFAVSGEVKWQGANQMQSARGAKVSVYDATLPDRYNQFPPDYDDLWETHELSVKKAKNSASTNGTFNNWANNMYVCSGFAAGLAQQFGGSMLPVESLFLYRPFKASTLEEWREIASDPQFQALSVSRQTDVRYVFWLRRVIGDNSLSDQDQKDLQRIIFPPPLDPNSQETMAKAGITGDWELKAIGDAPISLTEALTDSDGRFSVTLKKGTYLLVVQDDEISASAILQGVGPIPVKGTSVWVKRIEVAGDTKVFLTEPSCSP